jgi:hypothetical protein
LLSLLGVGGANGGGVVPIVIALLRGGDAPTSRPHGSSTHTGLLTGATDHDDRLTGSTGQSGHLTGKDG